jgi:hypothetical protein
MHFLYPTFLFSLLALAIPIIIHLYSFRRYRKVLFTNVRFLKEVKEETSARQKLRNLLVLAARCLALAALVFAFAQPFIPQGTNVKQGEQSVSIFVDNSYSMSALSQEAPLLEKAKQCAREIVEAYSAEDRFQILTQDFEGRHQRLVSKDEAIGLIDEIKVSPSVKDMSKVLQRQYSALNLGKAPNKTAFLISDFQKNAADFNNYKDSLMSVNLIPLTAVQEKNISIDSVWFEVPVQMLNQTAPLIVKVKNHTAENSENIRLSLKIDGQEKPVGTLKVAAKSTITDTINIPVLHTGWHEAVLSLTDYPVQFDDSYFFTYNVARQINTLIINENTLNPFLNAAFEGIGYFKVTNQNRSNIDFSKFRSYNQIVLNDLTSVSSGLVSELKQYVQNGGNVVVFPSGSATPTAYNELLNAFRAPAFTNFDGSERQVASVNTDEFVFQDVFINRNSNLRLPSTKGSFRQNSRGGEDLLTYRDGSSFLSKYKLDKGNFYLCTAPLDDKYGNLVKNGEIFIPMLYKMAISTAKSEHIAYTIGKDDYIEAESRSASGTETTFKIKGKTEEFIPEQRMIGAQVILGVGQQIREAGFYDLHLNPQDTLGKFAFNYDRKESSLEYFKKEELEQFTGKGFNVIDANVKTNFTQLVGERNQGIHLWKWFIVLALIFLATETLLLKFWKV